MRFERGSVTGKTLGILALAGGLALSALAQKSQKKDDTQTLQPVRDLPLVVEGDPRHFAFFVTPLSSKGLLSKQVHDALSALSHEAKNDPVLKIRAFVAGSGDARRVRDLVSEFFTDRKQALPVLSLVQAGGLPMEGTQVVLEAIVSAHKEVNPQGLAFISAQTESADDPSGPTAPLAAKSLATLREAVKAVGSEPADVLRVTCFFSSLDDLAATRQLVESQYRGAAADFVRTQRTPLRSLASCEAVARLRRAPAAPVQMINPAGLTADAGASDIALVAAPKVLLSGTQVSFGFEEKDARLAFQRMQKALEQAGGSTRDVAYAHFYPLASRIATQVRQVRGEFFNKDRPPATSLLLFEGLPSMDAGFALDVVAVK